MKKPLQEENSLIALVEEKVEDAQVGQEAMLLNVYLIVGLWLEGGIWQGMLGADNVAEIVGLVLKVFIGKADVRPDIEQLAHLLRDSHIEIEEERPSLLEERMQVVGIELEERTLSIRRQQCVPVEMLPVAMVADAYIAHLAFVALVFLYGHGESLRARRSGYDAAVAIGLLQEVVVLLNEAGIEAVEFLIPLHRTEISRGKEN